MIVFKYNESFNSKLSMKLRYFRYRIVLIKNWLFKSKQLYYEDWRTLAKLYKKDNKKSKNYPSCLTKKSKIAVYMCIFGNYDDILPIKHKSKYCDYFIITDKVDIDPSSGWKKRDYKLPKELENSPSNIKNRYFKIHPHLVFPDYEFSIYLDGNISIVSDIFPFMGIMGNKLFGLFYHPYRRCIYKEAARLSEEKAPAHIKKKQIEFYKSEGFPENYGLTENSLLIRKHNEKRCIDVMDLWWSILTKYTKRDQLSFMYSLWKNGLTTSDIAVLGRNLRICPRIKMVQHNHNKHKFISKS